MPFSAILDANVLYPFSLRDTLLRLAELELYTPLWSERILDEMRRNLVEHRLTDAQAASIEAAMRGVFEDLLDLGVEPQVRVAALKRPVAESVDLLVEPLTDPGDLALRDAQPQRL